MIQEEVERIIKAIQDTNKEQLHLFSILIVMRQVKDFLELPNFENPVDKHAFYMDQITKCIRLSVEIQTLLLTLGIEATHGRLEKKTKTTDQEPESEPEQM